MTGPGYHKNINRKEWRSRVRQEHMEQEVVDVQTLEDMKILLLSWIDDGSIVRRTKSPWEK